MVAIMLTAREALMFSGAHWEYAVFVTLHFAIVLYARILDENELNKLSQIRKNVWHKKRLA